MLFPSTKLVRRIEQAEAASLRALLEASGGAPVAAEIGGGLALYRGPNSPQNKVIGLGFEPLAQSALERIERIYLDHGTPVQVELSTHADPAVSDLLVQRGYRPAGFENVMGRTLADLTDPARPPALDVRQATDGEREAWIGVLTTGFHQRDGSAKVAAHDVVEREALDQIFREMADNPSLARWVALWEGQIAGGAGVSMRDGITQLFGAATHPDYRRRGIQSALLHARLQAGRERGCELAVITTQPGSKSQENAQRAGFSLLYARAVWLRHPAAT